MAETTKASPFQVLSADRADEEERWSPPQTAMFVTITSAFLWALIIAAARWLIG